MCKEFTEIKDENVEKCEAIAQEFENKPTQEEIEQYEADLKAACDEYQQMPPFVVGEGEEGLTLLETALFYNNEVYTWKGDEWQGVIRFNEMFTEQLKEFHAGTRTKFEMDVVVVQWLYYILTNMTGKGLDDAIVIDGMLDEFRLLAERVSEFHEEVKDINEQLRFLQDRVAAAYQGFYYRKDGIENEPQEESCDDCVYEMPKSACKNCPDGAECCCDSAD